MKNTIKSLIKGYVPLFVCASCVGFFLMGCSYFDPASPDAGDLAWFGQDPEVSPVVAEPLPEPVDVAEIIARSTQGRVQLYNIDPVVPLNVSSMVNTNDEHYVEEGGISQPSAVQIFPVQ